MKRKRILAWVLTLVLLLGIFPLPMASAAGTSTYQGKTYSTDYTTWRQADPAWGSTALGDLHTMAGLRLPGDFHRHFDVPRRGL